MLAAAPDDPVALREATRRLAAASERLGTWPLVSLLREAAPERELEEDLRLLE